MQCVESFDAAAFGISRVEAAAMDPQQRLLLERSYMAFHCTALTRGRLDGLVAGVFVGVIAFEFATMLATLPAGGIVYAHTSSEASIASGRLSYVLGLYGPCVSYDTACSSALTASHAALRALQLSEC